MLPVAIWLDHNLQIALACLPPSSDILFRQAGNIIQSRVIGESIGIFDTVVKIGDKKDTRTFGDDDVRSSRTKRREAFPTLNGNGRKGDT